MLPEFAQEEAIAQRKAARLRTQNVSVQRCVRVVLASGEAAAELGVEPQARVVASATYALDPQVMGAPARAIPKSIARAGLTPEGHRRPGGARGLRCAGSGRPT